MKKYMKIIFSILCAFAVFLPALNPFMAVADETTHKYSTVDDKSGNVSRIWNQIADDTWTMDIDGDGKIDVTLKSSTDSSGNDVWTYTFNVEDDEQDYYVFENMFNSSAATTLKEGYASSGSDGKMAVEADPGTIEKTGEHTYTVTNSKSHTAENPEYGSLMISKSVTGTMPDPEKKFSFTVTLSAGSDSALAKKIEGSKVFGSTPFMDGVAHVSLGNGGSVTITDLPKGLSYTVTEESATGYTEESKTGDTGTIAKDSVSEAVFTNHSDYEPPSKGFTSFVLVKRVTGASADPDAEYGFTVHLEGLVPDAAYQFGESDYKADDSGIADVSLSLKKDDSVVFENIPVGASYQVSEEGGSYIASYDVSDADGVNKIVSAHGENNAENKQLSTAKEMADDGESVTVTYTNHYVSVQNLTIRKFMSRSGLNEDSYFTMNSEFEITVDFSNLNEGTSFTSDVGTVTADEYGEASKTFRISATGDAGKVSFYDIPEGTHYRITETGGIYKPYYKITTVDTNGNEITGTHVSSSSEGKQGSDLSTGKTDGGVVTDETVEENESDTVTFVNSTAFNFGIIKTDKNDESPVRNAVYALYSYKSGVQTLIGDRTTAEDGFAGWTSIGSGVYVLKETTVPEGYAKNDDIILVVRDDGTVKYATSKDSDNDAAIVERYSEANINKMATWAVYREYKDKNSDAVYQTFRIEELKTVNLPVTGYGGIYARIGIAAGFIIVGFILKKKGRIFTSKKSG